MNIAQILVILLVVFCSLSEAIYYHLIKTENCSTSDQKFAVFKTCSTSIKHGFNIDLNIKTPMTKMMVVFFHKVKVNFL